MTTSATKADRKIALPIRYPPFTISSALSQLMVTASPPVSPSVVARILIIQNPKVTSGTLLGLVLTPVATRACLAISILFSWYLANFGHYDATYGSLGAAIGLMMWLWLSVIVILIGAERNAEIEHQTAHDTTIGNEKP